MPVEQVFIIWAVKDGESHILPGGFVIGSEAVFWAEFFQGFEKCDMIIDAVPARGYFEHVGYAHFCAAVSEESFLNAIGLLETWARGAGGIAETGGMGRGDGTYGLKFQGEG